MLLRTNATTPSTNGDKERLEFQYRYSACQRLSHRTLFTICAPHRQQQLKDDIAQTLAASLATLHAAATTICRPADPPSQTTRASCCNGAGNDALARLLLPAPLLAPLLARRWRVGRSLGVVKTRRA